MMILSHDQAVFDQHLLNVGAVTGRGSSDPEVNPEVRRIIGHRRSMSRMFHIYVLYSDFTAIYCNVTNCNE